MCGRIAPDRLRAVADPWATRRGFGLEPHCPRHCRLQRGARCDLDCRAASYSHGCIPAAGGCRLGRTGSPGPASNRSPGSVTDRTRRGTGPEIGPGRENGGIGRGVGRHENALIDGDRRRDAARDHGTARRRGAMSGAVHDHHAGSDRHRGRAHRLGATTGGAPAHHADSALHHHDADSARPRQSRRGASRRAGPCRRWSRPSRRPPWLTPVRLSTR